MRRLLLQTFLLFIVIGVFATSGQHWKEQRKFTMETLREFGLGRTIMEDKILEEIDFLVSELKAKGGKASNLFRLIQSTTANVLVSVVFGKRFEYDDPKFVEFLDRLEEMFRHMAPTNLINFIPLLRFIPGDMFHVKCVLDNLHYANTTLIEPSIEEHMKNYDENETNDFISCYIKEIKKMEKSGQNTTIDRANLINVIGDMFAAGTETTSTTILWTILYLLHHPAVYEKCYKEIQDVVGSGRLPSLKDRPSMPYNEAVLMEIQRHVNVAIVGVPHAVSHDTTFHGYYIPKNAIIIPSLDSVLSDDSTWGDGAIFRPERFIDCNGKITKPEEFIPFSLGRRICLGESLARMELFLIMTTLLQRFDFKRSDILPSLHGHFGLTRNPFNYSVRAIPR